MERRLIDRKDAEAALTWDLSPLYYSVESLKIDVERILTLSRKLEEDFQGKLNDSFAVNSCLDGMRELLPVMGRAGAYSHLRLMADTTDNSSLELKAMVSDALAKARSMLSFIDTEILENDEETLKKAIESSDENRHYLKDLLRYRPHILGKEAEKVISALGTVLEAPYNIYNRAKLADMDFGTFMAGGREHPLGFVLFENGYEFETDTEVRRAAFRAFSEKLGKYQNTVASVYQTKLSTEKALAEIRGFRSVTESLLFSQKVPIKMYDRQIDLIYERLAPHMRRFAGILKRIHGLDEMRYEDLKLAVDPAFEPGITVAEAKGHLLEGLSVLGSEYAGMISRAFDERWIDFVQNRGKSTGAFCSSPYGAHPYILISWTERMREVFVLAHELGHAGHFELSHSRQNVFDSRPSLYFIEAPSTMNEMLMANHLIKSNGDARFRRWVYSTMISRTYYHNFVTHLLEARYQREVYRIIENGGSVTASRLNGIFREVLEGFFGDSVKITEGAELTWMRQPHYFMGLYPYTYSAGLTIATEVAKRVESGDSSAIEDWKSTLEAGGTLDPIELARLAGVDITSDKPLIDTIDRIGFLIGEIERLTDEIETDKLN
ncbi:oligoendopeptidase F [Youngiibacter fragilis]|uniref:Oligopeptidase F n=1 Tax=Youngiibacter fragilis 232.1 TaxID=994573 RepID=V7I041_9CLOT|nr:oligoendopeptidase F [Youngiibacter fragilis]ETA79253.1 oligoendopeptidase F [Youngiibacter fragilis 232.1]